MEQKKFPDQNNGADDAEMRLSNFRFFPLRNEDRKGDRFLQPWLICQVYSSEARKKSAVRRAERELCRFFEQEPLAAILESLGSRSATLKQDALEDSARVYLALCRDDEGFGRKLFGLFKMKPGEREDKILTMVYRGMIPLLSSMHDFPEKEVMISALHRGCLSVLPQRKETILVLAASFEDEEIKHLLLHEATEEMREVSSER